VIPGGLDAGLPSDLLYRRPDIQQAEKNLSSEVMWPHKPYEKPGQLRHRRV